ncbi:MAG: hypothetical protein PF637_02335 [Spirochaetes bacterium]|nr:hypothetical protein [Spirochaetota bacterium]
MNLLPMALSRTGDVVVSQTTPDSGYFEYLRLVGSGGGALILHSDVGATSSLDSYIWGVNSDSLTLISDFNSYPDPIIVSSVNRRDFSLDVSIKCKSQLKRSVVTSKKEVAQTFSQWGGKSVVLKPLYGSSAFGFQIIRNEKDLAQCVITSPVVCEEWCVRHSDFSYGFSLSKEGGVSDFTIRTLNNTPRGIFSSVCLPAVASIGLLTDSIVNCCIPVISQSLHSAGYFGPVNCDGFVYREDGALKIEYCCEINARRSIADIMLMYGRLAGVSHSAIVSTQQKQRNGSLYEALLNRFPEGHGVVLLTPSRFDYKGTVYRARRLLYFVGAQSEAELERRCSAVHGLSVVR